MAAPRYDTDIMFWLFLWLQVLQVLCEGPPPPQHVHVDKWQMTWAAAAPEEKDVTYSVQYRSLKGFLEEAEWEVVPACSRTPSPQCDVAFTKAQALHGCVLLRVQAERNGLTSAPVEACSNHSDSCTPEFSLTAGPGSLAVRLEKDHSLYWEYADHVVHRIYFGKDGDKLEAPVKNPASNTFDKLQAGQKYCAQVEYLVYDKQVGLPGCIQCEVVPELDSQPAVIAAVLVSLFVFLILAVAFAYILLFCRKRIKECMRPPCEIPAGILERVYAQPDMVLIRTPSEEVFSEVSSITPRT